MFELAIELLDDDPDYGDFVVSSSSTSTGSPLDRPGRQPARRDVGRGGRVLLRRPPPPDGTGERLKVRSLVGLLPLCATTVVSAEVFERHPRSCSNVSARSCGATTTSSPTSPTPSSPACRVAGFCHSSTRPSCAGSWPGCSTRTASSDLHGIRSIRGSDLHRAVRDRRRRRHPPVEYEPAESSTGMFAGNSNWPRAGVVPVYVLILRALLQHYRYYGDEFRMSARPGRVTMMTSSRWPRRSPSA